MKTYEQRTSDVLNKITVRKKQRRFRAGVAVVSLVALLIVLFVPIDFSAFRTWQYRNSPYYDLICKLDAATRQEPRSLFDVLNLLDREVAKGEVVPDAPNMAPGVADPDSGAAENLGQYVETTDNQVAGVIEGDLIKRTDEHIFYLGRQSLTAYCIRGETSYQVGEFKIEGLPDKTNENGKVYWFDTYDRQMFLSEDGTTITLILSGYGNLLTEKKDNFLILLNLDVTDPTNIRELNRFYLSGSHSDSRLVSGMLMVFSNTYITRNDMDWADPTSFVPQYGQPGDMKCIAPDGILAAEELPVLSYTTVTLLDQKTLEMKDTAAFLSYSSALYVSDDTIFATHGYTEDRSTAAQIHTVSMTEIAAMSYKGGKLELLGGVHVEGSVKDQYSLDEKDGILRIVTATLERKAQYGDDGRTSQLLPQQRIRNANLYCIDLSDWSVVGKVEAFAPEGETVESVRFHGDNAYVCTAEVVEMTDPVYFFDLSDPQNITWKDTGTIDGYSSSLVNFENGNLLGIGYGQERGLKVEMYRETETGVVGFATYEQPEWIMATDYKAYFIDRENQIIGIPVHQHFEGTNHYLLLGFDGVQFRELGVFRMSTNADLNETRGLVIDGVAYLFDSGFYRIKLW